MAFNLRKIGTIDFLGPIELILLLAPKLLKDFLEPLKYILDVCFTR